MENNTIKLAVASMENEVAQHFGHCKNFAIYEVSNGKIITETSIPNPGHKPGYLPNYLNDLGVNIIISGGMGGGAIDIFNEKGIKVITGASGNTKDAIIEYINGTLKSNGSVCHEHEHANECGEH